jgi:hypothetical protein
MVQGDTLFVSELSSRRYTRGFSGGQTVHSGHAL